MYRLVTYFFFLFATVPWFASAQTNSFQESTIRRTPITTDDIFMLRFKPNSAKNRCLGITTYPTGFATRNVKCPKSLNVTDRKSLFKARKPLRLNTPFVLESLDGIQFPETLKLRKSSNGYFLVNSESGHCYNFSDSRIGWEHSYEEVDRHTTASLHDCSCQYFKIRKFRHDREGLAN